ncbi:MAG TPA: carboxyl transferase domain-containing protein, partial [Planctomycetaceae bacterium]|nr:carboxyl transferase domain-containing protein [Planctomycetaceae bacterium]
MLSLRETTEELFRQEETLLQGGGVVGQNRQRKQGRLPVRERLSLLLDKDSRFFELGIWAAYRMYTDWGDVPAAGIVTGIGWVCGRHFAAWECAVLI